mgnify:CR=1 FL=1
MDKLGGKNIAKGKDLTGKRWVNIRTPILPFKLGGKWYWFRKIKTTYVINASGESVPIRRHIIKGNKGRPKLCKFLYVLPRKCKIF